MKNFISKSVILIALVAFMGCSSDSSTPACVPVVCKNAGVSNPNCGCNCPEGYTGTDCSTQKLPSKILISKIRINKFPNSAGGIDDLGTNPDLFITIIKDNILFYQTTTYFTDANGDGSMNYDYSFSTPIECNVNSALFLLQLWDYDSNTNNDLMGTIVVSPYLNYKGFPTSLIIQDESGNYKGEIFVTYVF
jgi:hypothetical protein